MTNGQALFRATLALEQAYQANIDAYEDHGGGWGNMDASHIQAHILEHIEHLFKAGPKPEPLMEQTS
jgi:hypothetical protein